MSRESKKKEKKYTENTGLMDNATDYSVYKMSVKEKVIGFMIGFVAMYAATYLFFHSYIFSGIVAIGSGVAAIKIYRNHLINERKKHLLNQFKDMMESLAASYSAGKNNYEAFETAYSDLVNIYGKESDISKEITIIVEGIRNNFTIEELLMDFAERSGLDDVKNFTEVFEMGNRQGADIRKIVSDTRAVIGHKIDAENEIKKIINASKNEMNTLMVMPFVILFVMNSDSSMTIAENSSTNLGIKLICIAIFVIAYLWGRKIVNIKID